jgi:DNA-binding transcriptional ArsR family regulator
MPKRASQPAAVRVDPFEALGDPQRRSILALLGERPRAVGELAAALPVSRPAVSWHLRLLKDAGLVEEHRDGVRRIYALRQEGLGGVAAYLEAVWGEAAARFRLMAENTTERHDG